MKIFLIAVGSYLLIVNLWGFAGMGLDKRKARRNYWRISEFSLFIPALLGGAPGCYLGMHLFHHKTRNLKFVIGIPLVFFLQAAAVILFFLFSPYKISFM